MNYDSISTVYNDIVIYGKDNFIIVTGGIGDFLTVNYFLSYGKEKNIIFISKQSLKLKKIFTFYYPEKKKYALYFNFSLIDKPGFTTNEELLSFFPKLKIIDALYISEYFPLIRNHFLTIQNNKILTEIVKNNIRDVFNIPEIFAIINPYTEDNRINCINCNVIHKGICSSCNLTRNFVYEDYINIFNFLKEKKILGVIISVIPITIPNSFKDINIINLSLTVINIIDCIELVKQCSYFFGIDSVFSVIASKILQSNNIYVKCNNQHGHNNKDIYWFPNKNINLQSFINIKY
jgi:hypothetical protein